MATSNFQARIATLKLLTRISRYAAIATFVLGLLSLGVGLPVIYLAVAASAICIVSIFIWMVVLFVCFSRYSLLTMLLTILAANAFVVCLRTDMPPLVFLGGVGLLAMAAMIFAMVMDGYLKAHLAEMSQYLKSPARGVIRSVRVKSGDKIQAGQELMLIDDDSVACTVASNFDATIESIDVKPGQFVARGMILGVLSAS